MRKFTENQIDHMVSVAEEIILYAGLKTHVTDSGIEVDTIAGKMNYIPEYKDIMSDVYRFLKFYGAKLHSHFQQLFINEIKTVKTI